MAIFLDMESKKVVTIKDAQNTLLQPRKSSMIYTHLFEKPYWRVERVPRICFSRFAPAFLRKRFCARGYKRLRCE